jgi:carboxymethylenebutenolidase
MCVDDKCSAPETDENSSRRSFLAGATAAFIGVVLSSEASAQQNIQPPTKALEDPNIIHGFVSFKSNRDMIEGYQARPKAAGKYRSVIVLHGNLGVTEDHRYTAAQLAQAGFVALAVKRFSRTPELTIEELNRSDRSDRRYLSGKFNRQELDDAQAAIDYLKSQSFVRRGKVGMVGFCGGGCQSLLLAAESKNVKAVVAFYAPPILAEQYQVAGDPKPNVMDVISKIKVPVQGHYGTADPLIPVADVKKFDQALRKQGTHSEIYFYEGARHAFCDYTRRNYDAQAAALAKSRMLEFLKRRLK